GGYPPRPLAGNTSVSRPRFSLRLAILFSHRGSESDTDQQSFRRDETADDLSPRFILVLYKHSISVRFEGRRCRLDTIHVELKPRLRGINVRRPGIFAKTRPRRLREGPQRKALRAWNGFRMKVAVGLLFERNAQDIEVQLAAFSRVADNGTKTCD